MRNFLAFIVALLLTTVTSVAVLLWSIVHGIIESVKDGTLRGWRSWTGVPKAIVALYKLCWTFFRCNSTDDVDKALAEFKEEIDAL